MAATPATSTVTPGTAGATPPKGGRMKLMVMIGAAVLVLLVAAGVAMWLLKSKPPPADEGDEPAAAAHPVAAKHDAKKSPPAFMPLDPFTVNLADKEGERFAQIAITLELEDAHFDEQIKAYLPAIRNNILMALAQKTAAELLTREGKEQLAGQIIREALRPMGIEVPDGEDADSEHAPPKKKGKKKAPVVYPIKSVLFASFIIQ